MRISPAIICAGAALVIGVAGYWLRPQAHKPGPPPPEAAPAEAAEPAPPPAQVEPVAPVHPTAPAVRDRVAVQPQASAPFDRAQRLAQLRESFRVLAAGDPRTALQSARQLTNDVERETALVSLLTEWKHGELAPPRQRAWAIASLGLEAGLGLELAKNPGLAQLWASELTDGQSRAVAPERLAAAMVEADPAMAFAFSEQLSPADRRTFLNSAFATWAGKDTEAALEWAAQLSDPEEQDAAVKAIRSVAPVGIGAELRTQDGYPVINRLIPGSSADLGGQLHSGDRIVALAQGDNAFVDARSLGLPEVVQRIRGAPGTVVQLQVLAADASADSPPRTLTILRGQLKFKR